MTRPLCAIAAFLALLATTGPAVVRPRPRLLWNASSSVPIGFYAIHSAGKLHIGELVVVSPPHALARFLAGRRYLPEGVPMLKHVLALRGQTVCRTGRVISVDGIAMGAALDRDTRGRPLPVWQGCQRIPAGDVFLMNRKSPDSFDGRYFGLLPSATIIGRADPIWTRREG
ncbi:MAG TPA: conjugative transfer signal peptidase TraF [Stellaceae bacterium]|nr:conjugative transfer signal peptidase TraF [Stellaceae bacterium]